MVKRMIVLSLVLCVTAVAHAKGRSAAKGGSHYVAPHVTKNGTYVAGHMKRAPNNTKFDNYSTKGNFNPHTGKEGTKDPLALPTPPSLKY